MLEPRQIRWAAQNGDMTCEGDAYVTDHGQIYCCPETEFPSEVAVLDLYGLRWYDHDRLVGWLNLTEEIQ